MPYGAPDGRSPGPGHEAEIEVPLRRWSDLRAFRDGNLRRGAAFIRGNPPGPAGTPVVLVLVLPDDRRLRLRGEIAGVLTPAEAAAQGRNPGFQIGLRPLGEDQWAWLERQLQVNDPPPDPALVASLSEELRRLERLDPFQILGLRRDANEREILAAYTSFAQKWHPKRFETAPVDARQLAGSLAHLGELAYRRLSTPEARAELQASMASGRMRAAELVAPLDEPGDAPILGCDSKHLVLQAREAMMQRSYDEAVRLFGLALQSAPQDKEARCGLEVAKAHRAMQAGDDATAEQCFQRAIGIDPMSPEAVRGLRAVQQRAMEAKKTSSLTGLFRRTRK